MLRHRILVVGVAAVLLTGVAGVFGLRHGGGQVADDLPAAAAAPADRLGTAITVAQQRLHTVPGDYVTWAELGSAYIEKARVSADPGYYSKAEGALRRSLQLRPHDNATALIGLGALANARHDFAHARDLADQALHIDSYSADAYGVLADAHTQLGQPAAATDAVQHMLDLRPGLPAYARASYDLEQHGRLDEAAALMRRALDAAIDPADIAFCRYQLGELAWQQGQFDEASTEYRAGLAADASYLPLLDGRARLAAAQGRTGEAVTDYANLTARYPSPGYLIEYADLLTASGQPDQARAQLGLASAGLALFTANGGTDDLGAAQLAIAENKPTQAVAAAKREWSRRHFADVADTLAWALHQAGSDREALTYAKRATSSGARNASYLFHLGMIEDSLGRTGDARRDLAAALALNPQFSPRYAPVAAAALTRLGGR
jgi:tetratricopeptide (TPR) repeat protein